MSVGSALYDKHKTGLACIAQAKPYEMCRLHGFGVCFAHISSTFVAPKLVQCVKCGCYWQLICLKKCLGLQREPCLKSSLMAFLGPSWSQSNQNGPLSVELERTWSSKPKRTSQVLQQERNFFVHFSQSGVSAGLGWAWLIAGRARGTAARPVPAARP